MKKKHFIHIVIFFFLISACQAQTAGTAGSFARMGFSARGMSMGNALTAVSVGELSTYYNPALAAFSEYRVGSATFAILSLDRRLTSLSFTQAVKPTAGISAGMINAGVSKIDGRNSDGQHTEDYSTFENQFFLSLSNRVIERVSLGVTVKLYYSKLFDQVKSTTVGFDFGVCAKITDEITAGFTLQDIGSKYIWDTKKIYPDPFGKPTTDKFPNLRRIGISYKLPNDMGLISAEFENSSEKTNLIRFGAEYNFMEYFSVRSGVDRLDFSEQATGAKPSFGFTVKKPFNGWTPELNYAFVFESFAPNSMHIITLSAIF